MKKRKLEEIASSTHGILQEYLPLELANLCMVYDAFAVCPVCKKLYFVELGSCLSCCFSGWWTYHVLGKFTGGPISHGFADILFGSFEHEYDQVMWKYVKKTICEKGGYVTMQAALAKENMDYWCITIQLRDTKQRRTRKHPQAHARWRVTIRPICSFRGE